jgi:hypothetical protein
LQKALQFKYIVKGTGVTICFIHEHIIIDVINEEPLQEHFHYNATLINSSNFPSFYATSGETPQVFVIDNLNNAA